MRALVVTPTYQESENIVEFLERARAAAPDADILVVDDNSPDGTADLAEAVGRRLGHIEVLRRPRKVGIGEAVRAGFTLGLDRGYDVVVQIDADLSHDPAALPKLLIELDRGADAAIGSRYVPGGSIPHWPWYRRTISKWGNRYATLVLGIPIRDATSGYRAFRADILKTADFSEHAFEGLRLPDRALLPRVATRRPHRAGPDHLHRPRPRALEDVVERRRRRARPRHVVGLPGPRPEEALYSLSIGRSRCTAAPSPRGVGVATTSTPRRRRRR